MSDLGPSQDPPPPPSGFWDSERMRRALGVDLRGLATLRVLLGILLLTDLWNRWGDLTAHYSEQGVLPLDVLFKYYVWHRPTLHWGESLTAALMIVSAVLAVLLILGLRTRVVTILSWLLLISLHHRNPTLLSRGDMVLGLVLFWGCFLPLGARASLDARRDGGEHGPTLHVSLPALGLLLQMFSIYFFSAFFKSVESWTDGTAVYYALNLDQFVTPFGLWVLTLPALVEFLGRSVLWIELFGPWLIFVPYGHTISRTAAVLLFVGFHAGLGATMELGIFPAVCAAAWIALLPGPVWDRLARLRRPIDWGARVLDGLAARLPNRLLAGAPGRLALPFRILAGLLIAYLALWNVASLPGNGKLLPKPLRVPGDAIGLDQRWNMFSPYPLRSDGWFVIPATLSDGSVVDLYTGGGAVSWEKPALVSATFRTQRWRKLLMNIWSNTGRWQARYYTAWMRRDWEAKHPGRTVVKLELCYMFEMTELGYGEQRAYPVTIYRWNGEDGSDEVFTYKETRAEWKKQREADK